MTMAQRVVIGITEEDIEKAARSIAGAINASEASFDVADLVTIKRAVKTWLEFVVGDFVNTAAWRATNPRSSQRANFLRCLAEELERANSRGLA